MTVHDWERWELRISWKVFGLIRRSWWMNNLWNTAWWLCIGPKIVMDPSMFKKWVDGTSSNFVNTKCWKTNWSDWTVVVGENSKQRLFLCKTTFEETVWEFRSTHEEVDVIVWKSSCDEAMLHATLFLFIVCSFMNMLEEKQGGDNSRWDEFSKESNTNFEQEFVCLWNIQKMESESNDKCVFFTKVSRRTIEQSTQFCTANLTSTRRTIVN